MLIDRIISKFEQISKNIELIKKYFPNNEKDFSQLGLIKDGIYKRYEYSVELIIDIIAMINSHYKLGIPSNNLEIISNLKQNSIISSKTFDLIQGMKAFRNVLVHVYEKLDDILAYNNIKKSMDDFTLIEEEIMDFLKKDKKF